MPKKILAVDPGETTGFAYAQVDGQTVLLKDLQSYNGDQPGNKAYEWDADIIIIERSPRDSENVAFRDVMTVVSTFSVNTSFIIIAPGDWKPVAKAREWKCSQGKTQHEKDAANILRYYFWMKERRDIGELKKGEAIG